MVELFPFALTLGGSGTASSGQELVTVLALVLGALLLFVTPWLAYRVITLPLRRQERARVFLDTVEACVRQGKSVEEAIVSLADTMWPTAREGVAPGPSAAQTAAVASARREMADLGKPLARLADRLWRGQPLVEALGCVGGLVPPRVIGMLRVGAEFGDLRKVLPACRATLGDTLSRVRGAMNYLVVMASGLFFSLVLVVLGIVVVVLPRFREMLEDMRISAKAQHLPWPADPAWIADERCARLLFWAFMALALVLILAAVLYAFGPWVARAARLGWLTDRLALLLPWRRKQMLRDFTAMLAILLDADVPEQQAVELAAASTANGLFQRRAGAVVDAMRRGEPLTSALGRLDRSGELRWRMANAAHAHAGFLDALAGWHEALDAKAFQQEQTAAQALSTALVLANGFLVALFAMGLFQVLLLIIKAAVLW